jgi:hypothetical protein
LITPKLLAGLDYHPKMRILIVNQVRSSLFIYPSVTDYNNQLLALQGDWLPDRLSLKGLVQKKMLTNGGRR